MTAFVGLRATAVVLTVFLAGCARAPTTMTPQFEGSIGLPHRGMLTGGSELPRKGDGFRWLRDDDHHHGLPRFVDALERAAARVAKERPGGVLSIGDISTRTGGRLLPHLSHRTGRDADLLFYVTTLEGAPVESPGFVHFAADGLAWDPEHKRFLRFDVEREWLLVKALVEDDEARMQWLFVSRVVQGMLVEWARSRSDDPETILRAMQMMQQPQPGGIHDDHIHVRTSCAPVDVAAGCEPNGPARPWVEAIDRRRHGEDAPATADLLDAITRPLGSHDAQARR